MHGCAGASLTGLCSIIHRQKVFAARSHSLPVKLRGRVPAVRGVQRVEMPPCSTIRPRLTAPWCRPSSALPKLEPHPCERLLPKEHWSANILGDKVLLKTAPGALLRNLVSSMRLLHLQRCRDCVFFHVILVPPEGTVAVGVVSPGA